MYVHMIGVTDVEDNFDWIAKFAIRLAKAIATEEIKWPMSFIGKSDL